MKMLVKRFNRTIIQAAALILGASINVASAADKPKDIGKIEYEGACAVCHGPSGKGGGLFASQLVAKLPDLTMLASNNGGVFPFDRVYQIIDGRQEVKAHGSRSMPIWGERFNMQSSAYFENSPSGDTESAARSRILALTEYLYRLQGK